MKPAQIVTVFVIFLAIGAFAGYFVGFMSR